MAATENSGWVERSERKMSDFERSLNVWIEISVRTLVSIAGKSLRESLRKRRGWNGVKEERRGIFVRGIEEGKEGI